MSTGVSTATVSEPWVDAGTMREVRPAVRDVLMASPAFGALSPAEQQQLAKEMVRVSAYLANPEGLASEAGLTRGPLPEPAPSPGATLARAQAEDATESARRAAIGTKDLVGDEFKAGAVREGVEQFGELVKKVDFPKFVSGLIHGVFEAIVDTSIKQMRAYGELVANVAKTVDQFAQDNITENNGRDYLVNRFPDKLELEDKEMSSGFAADEATPPPQPRLVAKGEDLAAVLASISQEMKLAKPLSDLSDENQEAELVRQARLQMARGRQQMLASMVMLGINRIVVTDGLINAKVVFDMRASDRARRQSRASMADSQKDTSVQKMDLGYSSWFSPFSASASSENTSEHIATVQSSVDETSESKAEVKAKLTGEVRVNFKSDYFPMEKLASPQMIAAIQGNAVPPATPAPGA